MEQKPHQPQTHHPQKPTTQDHQKPPNNPTKPNNSNNNNNRKPIWDCGSTLYDSFELNSFQKQLDSAIINSSRTFSMPRLPSQEIRAPPPPPLSKKPAITSRFSRSFQKLIRSVFRASKPNHSKPKYDNSSSSSPDPWFLDPPTHDNDKAVDGGRYFVVYDKPSGLSTIPEVPEVGFSPDIRSLVKKTMSERFTAASAGIYCV